jgi:hypothetical protein
MVAMGKTIGWFTFMLMLALRIALAWTLVSLLLMAVWALLLEVGRRFGRGRASKPPASEERQLSAQPTVIYGDFVHEHGVRAKGFARCESDETGESDTIVLVWGAVPTQKE